MIVSAHLCTRAREHALAIGERMLCEANDEVRGLMGSAGDALLYWALTLATGQARYEQALHATLKRAAQGSVDPNIGLFGGVSGVRAVAALAMQIEPRYRGLVAHCDAFVESTLPQQPQQPQSYAVFDVMQGWAGARLARCVDAPAPSDRLTKLLGWLLEDHTRWMCPHPVTDPGLPVGDLGLAHGIAGVLSAIVLTHDPVPEPLRHYVSRTAALLAESALHTAPFATWPHSIGRPASSDYAAAWCYGTPGVAAALYTLGTALGDPVLAAFGLRSARDVAARDTRELRLNEVGICHGLLGNALCYASVAAASDCSDLQRATERLVEEALDQLDANEGRAYAIVGDDVVDATNELRGVGGVAVALLTLCNDVPSHWMRLHALRAA